MFYLSTHLTHMIDYMASEYSDKKNEKTTTTTTTKQTNQTADVHGLLFDKQQHIFYIHHSTDSIIATPVVENKKQLNGSTMSDRSYD